MTTGGTVCINLCFQPEYVHMLHRILCITQITFLFQQEKYCEFQSLPRDYVSPVENYCAEASIIMTHRQAREA